MEHPRLKVWFENLRPTCSTSFITKMFWQPKMEVLSPIKLFLVVKIPCVSLGVPSASHAVSEFGDLSLSLSLLTNT